MGTESATIVIVEGARYRRLVAAAAAMGDTEKALRRRIDDGKWLEGREYRKAPTGEIYVDMKGVEKWVEGVRG